MASVCRELDLAVTVAERADAPLIGALGGVIGKVAAEMQRDAGVDLRTGVSVEKLEGDAAGHVRRAQLSDGTTLDVDVVVASLGSLRNVEWLEGAGLATRLLGRWLRRRLPRLRHQRGGDRQYLRRGRHRARPPRAVRVPVYVGGALGQRGHRGRGRGAQHGEPRARPQAAPADSRLLVRPVRRQHQGRRRAVLRRRGGHYAGLRQGAPLRRRLWEAGPHRGRGHLQSRQVAGILRSADRAIGAVPAPAAGVRSAGRHAAGPGRVPGSAHPDGASHRCLDRP